MMNKFDLVFEQVMKSLEFSNAETVNKYNRYSGKNINLIVEDINKPIYIQGATRRFTLEETLELSEETIVSEGILLDKVKNTVKKALKNIVDGLNAAKKSGYAAFRKVLEAAKNSSIGKWLDKKYGLFSKVKEAVDIKQKDNGKDGKIVKVGIGEIQIGPDPVIAVNDNGKIRFVAANSVGESVNSIGIDLISEDISGLMDKVKSAFKGLFKSIVKCFIGIAMAYVMFTSIFGNAPSSSKLAAPGETSVSATPVTQVIICDSNGKTIETCEGETEDDIKQQMCESLDEFDIREIDSTDYENGVRVDDTTFAKATHSIAMKLGITNDNVGEFEATIKNTETGETYTFNPKQKFGDYAVDALEFLNFNKNSEANQSFNDAVNGHDLNLTSDTLGMRTGVDGMKQVVAQYPKLKNFTLVGVSRPTVAK